jgi:uncharacterized protein (DUF433 family)
VGPSVSVERYLAVPRERAARLAGLTLRQVDYWAKTGLIEPSVDNAAFGRRVRLYGFVDLLALTVAAKLKERNVSLQHIRAIVAHVKTRGYDRPFTDLQYATLGRRVYFQHPDGSWEGDARPDQLVAREVLPLRDLHRRILDAARRREEHTEGVIEKRRGVHGSKPVFAGTRVPVDTVQRYLANGKSTDEILAAFPMLTPADVDAARAIA